MDGEFTVTVADLEEGAREYVFPIRPEWIATAVAEDEINPGKAEGELQTTLTKSGKDVVVQGHIKVELEMPCARCSETAKVPVEVDITALMVPEGSKRLSYETEDVGDQLDLVPYDGQTVVLDDLVRDEILLGIPMMPLCSEDCPGMSTPSPSPGPEIDPRLEPLTRLKLPKE